MLWAENKHKIEYSSQQVTFISVRLKMQDVAALLRLSCSHNGQTRSFSRASEVRALR